MQNEPFDIIIIGSGMGGLVSGNVLSLEGFRVCILEKNKQLGGCLQIFVRDRAIFDSGVHYLGGLDRGQNLYQIFKYLGLIGKLKLQKMDEDGFDRIVLDKDNKEYKLAQGYPNFIKTLTRDFPEEEKAIRKYCEKIKETCSRFPLYNLERGGNMEDKVAVMGLSAQKYIESLTSNRKLQSVLAGNNILYAGHLEETPFYVHALILNSYIESSWKCIDGGSGIQKILAQNIRALGGTIQNHAEVEKIIVRDGRAACVELGDGSRIYANHFISNMHPSKTMDITETDLIRKVYRKRLKSLTNTVSVFIVNLVFKKNAFPYFKYNYYYHKEGSAWSMANYTEDNWPLGYAIYLSASSHSDDFAESMTIFTYMRYDEVRDWEHTFNTVAKKSDRGDSYELFKKRKAEKIIDCVEQKFKGLRNCIHQYYTSTPLSYRDYIGTDDGSLYGIAKDYKDPFKTLIPPRTKVPNLYLTGQNLNLHGILGSAISGLVTSAAFLDSDEFVERIKNA
ncbi:MAG: phytoene desaturase family protein [Chitinophagales bacterium]